MSMSGDDKVNILLVDDSQAKLLSHQAILEEIGENLITACSATQAFEVLLKNEIALILIDVCMPDLDGFELATMIRQHPRFETTAIIFVSAVMMTKPDQLRGYQLGGVDYVPVPVVPELLRAKVKVFVDLYRKTRQLERFNAELEQRVAERTAELQRFNEELEQRIEDRTRERETALAQLFEAQKMDTIGQLTGGVAHDFNNLLMAVLGSLTLLEKRLPPDDQHNRRLVQNAVQGAQRGAALTQRLLAFSRRQELKPESVDLGQLVSGMVDLLKRALGLGIELTLDFPISLPPVLADANQLELALLNLALNARDAMQGGGKLSIAASAESLSKPRSGQSIVRGRVRAHYHYRHRDRHGRCNPRQGHGAVLHDQGARQGDRVGPVHGPWIGGAVRGPLENSQRAQCGDHASNCGCRGRRRRPCRSVG
jgi:signal transduction histidine kinase